MISARDLGFGPSGLESKTVWRVRSLGFQAGDNRNAAASIPRLLYEPLSKLLVSPLITPIIVPYITPYITPF